MGALWLPIEAYEGLEGNAPISIGFFLIVCVVLALVIFAIDGFFVSGFFRKTVSIDSNGFDTKIVVKFGDLLAQEGWKSIAVNDFFDSKVDDIIISSNSLHGQVIKKYWPNNSVGWQAQIYEDLKGLSARRSKRAEGNTKLYPIGTTAQATVHDHKFLFTALTHTDEATFQTTASAETLICAVRGMLTKARSVCSNEPLFIPLMGTGLGRLGTKHAIVVDLILVAIFEETKLSKVTDTITIVISNDKSSQVNLASISRDWK